MCVCVCLCVEILDLLIEVFNKGGDAKLDVAVSYNRVPDLMRISVYVTVMTVVYVYCLICCCFL